MSRLQKHILHHSTNPPKNNKNKCYVIWMFIKKILSVKCPVFLLWLERYLKVTKMFVLNIVQNFDPK